MEIICIDDGSTDGSAAILREYAAKDLRIEVITQENAGAGVARNVGLARASGEWLSFLDADDEFEPSMLSDMVSSGDAANAEVVACTRVKEGDIFCRWRGWAWDKLFRREFILKHKLEFQNLAVSNDLFFTYSALALSSKTIAIAKEYVMHRKREGSVETTRDRDPLAPIEAVKALYSRVGMINGFARWVPEFLFWHINRLKSADSSELLYSAARRFGEDIRICSTLKWKFEELKRVIKKFLRRVSSK
jgi:glycosyltransferase involved in cell wall biosynthesis